MDETRYQRINDVFHEVIGLDPAQRTSALERACNGDTELRRTIERMVAADSKDDLFMEPLGFEEQDSTTRDRACEPGTRIGAYRVVRHIGAGGMGDVYLAERADRRFERQVAVKVLKRGMDTDDLLRRFGLEREVLASLDHPGIARLVDAGSLVDGRPFLVMEHVDGRAIDADCDARRLTVDHRLRLFLEVCDAVDHAHRRLVVHRDLKPANILVQSDGRPRLLDFGVAKLISTRAAAVTVTGLARPMTPEYASPEQIDGKPASIASDVYSLGVILHELLTGQRPLGWLPDEVGDASASATTGSRVAERSRARGTTPHALARRLSADLDNIVRMALHPDPARRYATVDHLASDIRRHLDGHPVVARRPTTLYRVSKFIRRNRLVVALAGMIVLSLMSGMAGLTWKATEASRARDAAELERARAEAVVGFLQETLGSAHPDRAGREVTVAAALATAAGEVAERFDHDPELREAIQVTLGETLQGLGRYEEAQPLFDAVVTSRERRLPPTHPQVARAHADAGIVRYASDDLAAAETHLERALSISRVNGDELQLARALNNLAALRNAQVDFERARPLYAEALAIWRRHGADVELELAETLNNLASTLRFLGDHIQAEQMLRESYEIRSRCLPEDHSLRIQSGSNLAVVLMAAGRLDEAEALVTDAIARQRRVLGDDHPALAVDLANLAALYEKRGDFASAVTPLRESVRIRRASLPPDSLRLAGTIMRLGVILADASEAEGFTLLRECRPVLVEHLGEDHATVQAVDRRLSSLTEAN